ncbi:DNA repair protein RecO [soil metagenome]
MAIVRTEAFVLKAIPFGETSVICRLFTRDHGVVPVIAKGARRPRNRFGAGLDPFRRLGVTYYDRAGREIQTLTAVELLAAYPSIARSLERMEAAGAWFRFLRRVLPDGAPAEALYRLMTAALPRLERTAPARVARWETYHRAAAAAVLGLEPRLEGCATCGRALPDGGVMGFALEEGGVVCAGCRTTRPGGRPLQEAEYALLNLYLHPDYSLVEELESLGSEERQVQELIHDFIQYHAL